MTMLPIMTQLEAQQYVAGPTRDPDLDLDGGATRLGGLPAFRNALKNGHFPVVPDTVAAAAAAMDNIIALEQEVLAGPLEGLSPFCNRVAADVLAGKGYPSDFADGAYAAQQAAERANASQVAVQTIRDRLHLKFPHVIQVGLPGLLAGLRTQVSATMKALRKVDQVLGDLDLTDPAAVAAATDEQRAAFLEFNDLHVTYKRARYAQRSALQASAVKHWEWWSPVFEVGIHECGDVREHGALNGRVGSVNRFRGLAHRPDVWVPTLEELDLAWDLFNAPRPRPVDASKTTTTGSAA